MSLIITPFLSSPIFAIAQTNTHQSVLLNEENNIEYGVLSGGFHIENQYIKTEYATDIRFVKEGRNINTISLENQSATFLSTVENDYTSPYYQWTYDDYLPSLAPVYIQGLNKTGYAPHINFTRSVEEMGYLSLNGRTAFTLAPKHLYVFRVNLPNPSVYDLNARSTANVDCMIFDRYNTTYSIHYQINGVTREIQPLYSRTGEALLMYLYSEDEADLIIEPRRLSLNKITPNTTISRTFVNGPDKIWNETIQNWQPNKNKENIHAFYVELPAGAYHIKYSIFSDVINSKMLFATDRIHYTDGSSGIYHSLNFISHSFEQTVYYAFRKTRVYILITSEPGVEFDYLMSIKPIDVPIFSLGTHKYQGTMVYFLLNITQPEVVFLNKSGSSKIYTTIVRFAPDISSEKDYFFLYTIVTDPVKSQKILLKPGLYFVLNNAIENYDFLLTVNEVPAENFSEHKNIQLSQNVETPDSYKLLEISLTSDRLFDAFNFSFSMHQNYTITIQYSVFTPAYPFPMINSLTLSLGNQQQNGEFVAYEANNVQELIFFSPEPTHIRYLLVSVLAVYNNTGASSPNPGTEITNSTLVSFDLIQTDELPNTFKNLHYEEKALSISAKGNAFYKSSFSENDIAAIYALRLKVQSLIWYDVDVTIVNGTIDNTYHILQNSDNTFQGYIHRFLIWNYYYANTIYSQSYIGTYDGSNISHVTWHTEFGTQSENLVLFLAIDPNGMNGTVEITFTAHNCTPIRPLSLSNSFKLKEQYNLGLILGVSIGGAITLTVITLIVVRLTKFKKR